MGSGAARGSPGHFTPKCAPGCQTELPGSALPLLWMGIWVRAGACEHPGCGRGVPAAGQGTCSHSSVRGQTLTPGTLQQCEGTNPQPPRTLLSPGVAVQGWLGAPAQHREGFGSGPWQPCVLGHRVWKLFHIWKDLQPGGLDCSRHCQAICRCMEENNAGICQTTPWNCHPCLVLVC